MNADWTPGDKPTHDGNYLVTMLTRQGALWVGIVRYAKDHWFILGNVIAFMELPERYQERKEG